MFVGMGEDGNIKYMIQDTKCMSTSFRRIGTMTPHIGNVCLIIIEVRTFCFNVIKARKRMRAEVQGL